MAIGLLMQIRRQFKAFFVSVINHTIEPPPAFDCTIERPPAFDCTIERPPAFDRTIERPPVFDRTHDTDRS
jgi:hypothetical protein